MPHKFANSYIVLFIKEQHVLFLFIDTFNAVERNVASL